MFRLKFELDRLFTDLSGKRADLNKYKSDGPMTKLEMLSGHWRSSEQTEEVATCNRMSSKLGSQRYRFRKIASIIFIAGNVAAANYWVNDAVWNVSN